MNTAQPELEDVVNLDHAASGMLLHLPAASRFALACTSRGMRDLHNAYVSAEEHARLLLHAHRAFHCERYERWAAEHRARWKLSILDDMDMDGEWYENARRERLRESSAGQLLCTELERPANNWRNVAEFRALARHAREHHGPCDEPILEPMGHMMFGTRVCLIDGRVVPACYL